MALKHKIVLSIEVILHNRSGIGKWNDENIGIWKEDWDWIRNSKGHSTSNGFCFKHEEDAMAFKLRWL